MCVCAAVLREEGDFCLGLLPIVPVGRKLCVYFNLYGKYWRSGRGRAVRPVLSRWWGLDGEGALFEKRVFNILERILRIMIGIGRLVWLDMSLVMLLTRVKLR